MPRTQPVPQRFLKHHAVICGHTSTTWASITVGCDAIPGLHTDHGNQSGSSNFTTSSGPHIGGVQDPNGREDIELQGRILKGASHISRGGSCACLQPQTRAYGATLSRGEIDNHWLFCVRGRKAQSSRPECFGVCEVPHSRPQVRDAKNRPILPAEFRGSGSS